MRIRTVCHFVFALAGAAGFVCAACADDDSSRDELDTLVSELQPFWLDAMSAAGITGQDGGNDMLFDGGALWSFGDTGLDHDSDFSKGPGMSNSALLVNVNGGEPEAQYLADAQGHARYVIPFEEPETWEGNRIWPGAGIALGDGVYLYFEIVVIQGAQTGAPAGAGLSRASLSAANFIFTRVTTQLPVAPHSVVLGTDGWLYLYGIRRDGFWDSWVTLYRVEAEAIEDPQAYELVNDRLVKDVYGQVNVAWNDYLGRYVMLQVGNPGCEPQHFYMRSAPRPDGPFSDPLLIAHLPGQLGPGDWEGLYYCPYLHPELFRERGRIMVFSYCVVGEEIPHLVEVELLD